MSAVRVSGAETLDGETGPPSPPRDVSYFPCLASDVLILCTSSSCFAVQSLPSSHHPPTLNRAFPRSRFPPPSPLPFSDRTWAASFYIIFSTLMLEHDPQPVLDASRPFWA